MTRYYILFIFSIAALSACESPKAKKKDSKNYIEKDIVLNDTLFLKREVRDSTLYQQVFVEPDKNSPDYLNAFNLNKDDSVTIKQLLTVIHKKTPVLKKFDTYGLASYWRPVYSHKSKYYIYIPSDSGNSDINILNDSLLTTYYFGDGYMPMALKSITKVSDKVFSIKTLHQAPEQGYMPTEINIYIIDPKTKLSVWEFKTDGQSDYQLMIPKEHVKEFPIVINYKNDGKREEFDFDKIDFKKLIEGVK